MTKEPNITGATCDICKQPVEGTDCVVVQAIADDKGNPIIDAPFVWFHKICLNPQ